MNRNLGFSTGILAIIALALHVSLPTGGEKPTPSGGNEVKPPAASETSAASQIEGPWLATRRFFGPRAVSYDLPRLPSNSAKQIDPALPGQIIECARETATGGCASHLREYFGIEGEGGLPYDLNIVLATVPDPMHTRVALFTDSSIHAMENAASAADWVFAARWFPWSDTVDPSEKDPAKRRKGRKEVREQESQPGILVFRSAKPGKDAVLVVFIVGETPTGGISRDQFQLARAYSRVLEICNSRPVRIQGPTFSGSFASLARAISEDKTEAGGAGKTYIVRSGTATSVEDEAALGGVDGVDFKDAIADGDDQFGYFLKTLDLLGIDHREAAVLDEDESSFGNAVAELAASRGKGIQVFRYPRDISHLRNAYRENAQASRSGTAAAPDLDFSLKDSDAGEDSVPTFSNAQTPVSENGILNEITSSIRRQHLRMVEIIASNVLDAAFLVRVLSRQCPDTRLVVMSPELLYVEDTQTDPLTGLLALSTYPLFPEAGRWMGEKSPPVHSDANSEGVYNATLLLLTRDPPDQSNRKYLTDYHWHNGPERIDHPPFWLLMLDREGFLPVQVWTHPPQDRAAPWFEDVVFPDQPELKLSPSRTWTIVSSVVALSTIGLLLWAMLLEWKQDLLVDARLEIMRIGAEQIGRIVYLFLLAGLLEWMQILLCMPLLQKNSATLRQFSLLIPGLIAGAVILAVTFQQIVTAKVRFKATLLIPAGLGIAGTWLWYKACFASSDQSFFLAFRAVELRLGSSPLWPLLAATLALIFFSCIHVTRLYFAAHQEPTIVTGNATVGLPASLQASRDEFTASMRSITGLADRETAMWFGAFVAVALGVCALFRIQRLVSSIDGWGYDLLLGGLQAVLIAALALTCLQVRNAWHSLHEFLATLETLPLARSFMPMEAAKGTRPIWVRRLNLQCLDSHLEARVRLHDLALLGPAWNHPGQEDGWYSAYKWRIDALLRREERDSDKPKSRAKMRKQYQKLRHWSQRIATGMLDGHLAQEWQEGRLAMLPEPAAGPRTDIAGLCETFVALHYSGFLLYGVRQIQNLMVFVSVGFPLLMVSLSAYSVQAPLVVGRFLLVLFGAIGVVMFRCLAGMERDPILSRLGNTTPGELDTEFYFKLAGYGALPVLGLLASEFPSISNFLFSWVQPALEALK